MTRYEISRDHSVVVIDARSSVHPIHSETRGLEGYVDLEVSQAGAIDLSAAPTGHLELSADQLEWGNSLYDREMHRRIDAIRFPFITGDLIGMTEGESPGRYLVRGEVNFHGVARHYEEEMTFVAPEPSVVELKGSHVFDIRDFGVDPPKMLMLRVFPEVTVTISISARRAG
ncbi:MAG: YceI family protein [Acidimicrobiales bacterium]